MRQIITRFIPYELKVQLHRAFDSVSYHVGRRTGLRDSLIPPPWLHPVGGDDDYIRSGEEFFRYFVEMAGLLPQERVLDVGCGTGRMARPLARYLKGGSYDGIDIVAPSINWCRQTYSDHYPNFRFHFTDIYNQAYNSAGRYRASEYRFPFESLSFDFVFLTSVFTHLLPPDMENYLSEVARVLKHGGRCLITYFLLTPDSLELVERQSGGFTFRYARDGCRVENEELPETAIAYAESSIRHSYEKVQLHISQPISYGTWCGRKDGLSYQDIVIASKQR